MSKAGSILVSAEVQSVIEILAVAGEHEDLWGMGDGWPARR
jgi:hypothetical protein